jgi:hypothetical protein
MWSSMLGARSVALVSILAPAKSNVPTWKAADLPNSDVDLARLHRNVSQQLARLGLRRRLPTAAAEWAIKMLVHYIQVNLTIKEIPGVTLLHR